VGNGKCVKNVQACYPHRCCWTAKHLGRFGEPFVICAGAFVLIA